VRWLALALLFAATGASAEALLPPNIRATLTPPRYYGYGSATTGCGPGIGGCSPYTISSTANSGAGTLRDFWSVGNRYIAACTTSGTVTFTSNMVVTVDNWSTAGLKLCPNQGIQTTGAPIQLGSDSVHIQNAVVSQLKARLGDQGIAKSLEIRNGHNIVVIYNSLQLGGDTTFDLSGQGITRSIYNITIAYNIIGPTLGCSNAALPCHQASPHNDAALFVGSIDRITVWRNLIGNGGKDGRNPRFAPCGLAQSLPDEEQSPGGTSGRMELIENYLFGSKYAMRSWPDQDCTMYVDLIRNVFAESTAQVAAGFSAVDVPFDFVENNMEVGGSMQVHAEDNIFLGAAVGDQCDMTSWDGGTQGGAGGPLCDKPQYVAAARSSNLRLSTLTPAQVVEVVLQRAGARTSCRDSFDKSLIALVRAGTGMWIVDGLAEIGGLPTLTTGCT
jgi:hypothetical protein